jgi:hypothetical protein
LTHKRCAPFAKQKNSGDFASVLEMALSTRSTVREGKFTLKDVNDRLDAINTADNPRQVHVQLRVSTMVLTLARYRDQHQKVFREFYDNCTAAEQKWIVRIILKSVFSCKKGYRRGRFLTLLPRLEGRNHREHCSQALARPGR